MPEEQRQPDDNLKRLLEEAQPRAQQEYIHRTTGEDSMPFRVVEDEEDQTKKNKSWHR